MTTNVLDELMQRANLLTPDEQLVLATRLIERARQVTVTTSSSPHRLKWRDIRGLLPYPALGEDAQAYNSRTRREGTEHREQALKREP